MSQAAANRAYAMAMAKKRATVSSPPAAPPPAAPPPAAPPPSPPPPTLNPSNSGSSMQKNIARAYELGLGAPDMFGGRKRKNNKRTRRHKKSAKKTRSVRR